MAEILKPYDPNIIWADNGDVSDPNTTEGFDQNKIRTGWEEEIPPLQDFNFIDNRQDQFNAYVNQHGIVEWDANTEYQVNKSFVQVDGFVYRALKTSKNVSPVGDTTSTWSQAFALLSDVQATSKIRGKQYFMGQL